MGNPKTRFSVQYDINEKKSIRRKAEILELQIKDKSEDNINKIFPNQDECGKKICNAFQNREIISCLVYGMTQTGKTGCMTALILHYVLENLIPINNIYIITGLSDIEWKRDTKNRMPESINSRVFHRANLTKSFYNDVSQKNKKNILIIMDEIQIACKEGQTIHTIFREYGLYDLDFLLERDIKLVQFSATPDGNINDINDWRQHSTKVKLSPGYGYYGAKEALEQNRVKQYRDLKNINNVIELKNTIENAFKSPRYHIIRVPSKRVTVNGNNQEKVLSNLREAFGDQFVYNTDHLKIEKGYINDLLQEKPDKHTFVFICEKGRCAKTYYKRYIGVSYERIRDDPDDSNILQGSFGR